MLLSKNITRQKWEDTYVNRPAWMRAEMFVMGLKQHQLELAAQGMTDICTLLPCAPGPREGVAAAQRVTEEQVMAAIKHR